MVNNQMLKNLTLLLSLFAIAVLAVACDSQSQQTGVTRSVSNTIDVENVIRSANYLERSEWREYPVNNCGNRSEVKLSVQRSRSLSQSTQVSTNAGIPSSILLGAIGAEYGWDEGVDRVDSAGLDFIVEPGSYAIFVVKWTDNWEQGMISVFQNGNTVDIPYEHLVEARPEIENIYYVEECGPDAVLTATAIALTIDRQHPTPSPLPSPELTSTPTPTPGSIATGTSTIDGALSKTDDSKEPTSPSEDLDIDITLTYEEIAEILLSLDGSDAKEYFQSNLYGRRAIFTGTVVTPSWLVWATHLDVDNDGLEDVTMLKLGQARKGERVTIVGDISAWMEFEGRITLHMWDVALLLKR